MIFYYYWKYLSRIDICCVLSRKRICAYLAKIGGINSKCIKGGPQIKWWLCNKIDLQKLTNKHFIHFLISNLFLLLSLSFLLSLSPSFFIVLEQFLYWRSPWKDKLMFNSRILQLVVRIWDLNFICECMMCWLPQPRNSYSSLNWIACIWPFPTRSCSFFQLLYFVVQYSVQYVGQVASEILRRGVELRFHCLFLIENFPFLDIP